MADLRPPMHYRVVFKGRLAQGKTLAEVREAFGRQYGDKVAQSVFARSQVVLKKGLERETADQFREALLGLGMQVSIEEELPEGFQLSLVDEPKAQAVGAPTSARKAEKGVIEGRAKPRSAPKNETYTLKEIRDAFQGEVHLPAGPREYTSRFILVALAMLMLPLAYIGLAVLSVYLTIRISISAVQLLLSAGSPYLLFLYVILAIAGLLVTAFLLKPLIARIPKGPAPVRIDPSREPVLYCLVGEVADAIGAPAPDEILLDAQINASAGLTRGPLAGELTLTLGLPLIWGTNVNTLAGILAHEFGHFIGKWGMRARWLVHWTNLWLYRHIHERDRWDLFVAELERKDNIFLNLAARVAQLGSAMCRYVLTALSMLAHRISFSFSRQREFDADRYQTALLGSDRYEKTAERLRVLGAAWEATISDLSIALDAGKKVDNLPRMVALRADGYSAAEIERISSRIEEVNTSIWDTHPTDKERIRAAKEARLEAKFDLEGSARGLLREIDRLSRMATLQWYRSFGLPTSADELLPIEAFASETDALTHASESIERYFGVLGDYSLYFELPEEQLVARVSTDKLVPGLAALNEKVAAIAVELAGKRDRLRLTRQYQWNYSHALFWRRAGLEIEPAAYQPAIETTESNAIGSHLARHRKIEGNLMRELRDGAQVLGKKLGVALELARREDTALDNEVAMLRAAYTTVAQTYDDERTLTDSCVEMEMLFEACRVFPDAPAYPRRLRDEAGRNDGIQVRIREILGRTRDPSKPGLTLADVLPERAGGERDPSDVLTEAGMVLRQLARLGFRLLGRKAEIARLGEQQHGLS